jgi:3-methyladenine DNA glycosylase AlkD
MNRTKTTAADIIARLRALANPENVAGMARFGINPESALGISVKTLREFARETRQQIKDKDERHALAAELWASSIHEVRILASIVDEPSRVSAAQMEAWAADFNSWDLVDQVCGNLFDKSPYGYAKALEWSAREEEFVRRAGFALMNYIALHAKHLPDPSFEPFFQAILTRADDERNFVKKAVNWALRGIGKRSKSLNTRAVEIARQMEQMPSRTARWNAKDALKELTSEAVQKRLGNDKK